VFEDKIESIKIFEADPVEIPSKDEENGFIVDFRLTNWNSHY